MQTLLIIFITITALAVVIQTTILAMLYVQSKKAAARMEAMTGEIHKRAIPVLDAAGAILTDSREKLHTITENLAATSCSLRSQVERMDHTISDVIDRTRLQVIRADDMISRAMDRVEETTELVQHSVISPVRQIAGIVSGLTVGLQAFFKRGHKQEGMPQDEELFI
jgi:ABC-type transporter Mla subunit MlaD